MTVFASILLFFSFIGAIAFPIIMLISKIRKKPIKRWRNGLIACVAVFIVSAALMPKSVAPEIEEAPFVESGAESSLPEPSRSSSQSSSMPQSSSSSQSSASLSESLPSSSSIASSSSTSSVSSTPPQSSSVPPVSSSTAPQQNSSSPQSVTPTPKPTTPSSSAAPDSSVASSSSSAPQSSLSSGSQGGGAGNADAFNTYSDTEAPQSATYVGNSNTMKFHYPTCSQVKKIKPDNIVSLPSKDEAIKGGYDPCGVCKP